MTAPAAAHIFNDLYSKALRLLRREGEATPFALKMLEREAETLAKASRSASFEIRAHLCAVAGDRQPVLAFYERALATAHDDYLGTFLRGVSLWKTIGESSLVFETYCRNRDLVLSSPEGMRAMELILACSGYFQASAQLATRMNERGIARDARLSASEAGLSNSRAPADGYDDASVAEVVGFVNRYFWEKKVPIHAVQPNLIALENGEDSLLITLFIGDEPGETADLEWELFGALGDAAYPLETSGKVRVALTPREGDFAEGEREFAMDGMDAD